MANDREIELKLAISPGDAGKFRQLPLLCEKAVEGPTHHKVFSVYFDTPGLALKHHAMALRLRKAGGKWLQTLKTAGVATGGLHQRGEWEHRLQRPQLDLALFRDTPLATLAQSKALHLTLKPAFTTEFDRTTWLVEVAPGQRVEVALDQGFIRCGEQESVISEVEIELLEGSAAAVFDLALALAWQITLQPEILSKAERGYRLFRPEPLVPRRAAAIQLMREWTPSEAMRAIVTACLDHFDGNVEGAIAIDDAEYIHQLRVALRRLRSAMRIFRPAHVGHISPELKWLTAELGNARDWDVLVTQCLPALLHDFNDRRAARKLMAAAKEGQLKARRAACAALSSARKAGLMISLARWISVAGESALSTADAVTHGNAAPARARKNLCRFASRKIRRRHRRLLHDARGGALTDLSVEARHRIRIDAKRLRYAADFFSSLFNEKKVARYVEILGQIQTLLGEVNDNAIAMHLLEGLAPPGRFTDFATAWFSARTEQKLDGVHRHLVELKDTRHFWKH